MKIWAFSDLHVDGNPYTLPGPPEGTDVVVIAGDVVEGIAATARWLLKHAGHLGLPVIYVPGNHDPYGGHLEDLERLPGMLTGSTVHALTGGQTRVFSGVRFVGATLWTDYAISDNHRGAVDWAEEHMPDFVDIRLDGGGRLKARHIQDLHRLHRAEIGAALATPFDGPSVVVTHHAPHAKSLRSGRVMDASDASFASDMTWHIHKYAPSLWIHGHVHSSVDYLVGATRVIANPRGYRHENAHFDSRFVVELSSDTP